MRHTSFRRRLALCMICVALAAFLAPLFYARIALHKEQLRDAEEELTVQARSLAALFSGKAPQEIIRLALPLTGTGRRLTVMEGNGAVLFDSQRHDADALDNHADRPEVTAARMRGTGHATRYSLTLGTELLYAAARCDDGRIVRLARPYLGLATMLDARWDKLAEVAILALGLSLGLSLLLSRGLQRQLQRMITVVEAISLGDYDARLREVPGQEFTALADAVNRLARNLKEKIAIMHDQAVQLESILNTMDDGLLVLDGQGRIRRMNRAFLQLFPAARTAHGASVIEAVSLPRIQDAVDKLLAARQWTAAATTTTTLPPCQEETQLQLECSSRSLNVHLTVPATPTAELGVVAVFRDISEMLRLERVRQDFVANASHELRTPLTAIQGYAETLADLASSEEQRHFCEVILKNSAYMQRMMEDLLTLARLEKDGTPPDRQPVCLHACLDDALSFCRQRFDTAGVNIVDKVPDKLTVMGNARQITQVFVNLLENAVRYAPEGSDVSLNATVQDGMVHVSVGDQGKGIPPEDIPRLFERFYRVEKHRGQGSTGLGLAICKHIVERHHGRIWVESPAPQARTLFHFTLPAAAAKEEA